MYILVSISHLYQLACSALLYHSISSVPVPLPSSCYSPQVWISRSLVSTWTLVDCSPSHSSNIYNMEEEGDTSWVNTSVMWCLIYWLLPAHILPDNSSCHCKCSYCVHILYAGNIIVILLWAGYAPPSFLYTIYTFPGEQHWWKDCDTAHHPSCSKPCLFVVSDICSSQHKTKQNIQQTHST